MNNTLPLKINDYSGYVSRAVKNYKERFYSDSAINCRKAAEAACKIIIHNAYPEKLAETKLNGKSLKDLIILLIHEGLVPRKTVNTLETLQIIGNKAAHDNPINKEDAIYAINALSLFTEYLFKEHLRISTPSAIDFTLEAPIEKKTKPEVIEKIIVQEKFDKKAEKEIFNKIKDIEEKSQGDTDKYEELKKELFLSRQKINELAQQQQAEEINPTEKKKNFKKIGLLIISMIVLLIATGFLIKYFFKKDKPEEKTNSFTLTKHPDSIYVAVNAIQVMQDNPAMDFKIETALYNRIHNLSVATNLEAFIIFKFNP